MISLLVQPFIYGPSCSFVALQDAVVDKLVFQISKDLHRQIVVLTLGSGKDLYCLPLDFLSSHFAIVLTL